jgi:hypothetical protein
MDDKIREIYEKTGYFENYGISVLLAVMIVVITFAIVAFNSSQSVFKMMQRNWTLNKCNPIFMPFAGIVMPIPGVSSFDNVSNNFNYCIQSDLSAIFSVIMLPIEFGLYLTIECIDAAILSAALLTKLMQLFQFLLGGIFKSLFDKIISFIVPLVVMCINAREMMAKMNGMMITVLYTVMGIYNLTISGTSSMLTLALDVFAILIGVIIALMVIAVILIAFFFTGPIGIAVAAVAAGLAGVATGFIVLYGIMDSFSHEVFDTPRRQGPTVPSTSVNKRRRR